MLETKFFSILFYLMHPLEVYYYNNLINSVIFIIYLQFLYSAYYITMQCTHIFISYLLRLKYTGLPLIMINKNCMYYK